MDVFKQDLPPPGGYKPIPFARVPAKSYFSGSTMIGGFLAVTAGSLYLYYLTYKSIRQEEVERRSGHLAMYPMLLAERDRAYLKQLRKNRDEEAELMKNVPGWEVGTWYGEPIYKTTPKDKFIDPMFMEYYVHSKYKDISERAHMKLWS